MGITDNTSLYIIVIIVSSLRSSPRPLGPAAVPRHSWLKKAMSAGSNGEPMEATTSSMEDTGTCGWIGPLWVRYGYIL